MLTANFLFGHDVRMSKQRASTACSKGQNLLDEIWQVKSWTPADPNREAESIGRDIAGQKLDTSRAKQRVRVYSTSHGRSKAGRRQTQTERQSLLDETSQVKSWTPAGPNREAESIGRDMAGQKLDTSRPKQRGRVYWTRHGRSKAGHQQTQIERQSLLDDT
ncbi:hypothetical protein PoB_005973700 [Plakobranchus ocellatus]|uniref:RNase H type-1 domain-containing protein n=1 Tax=Plakobranchus ocellatus TaxID=259542 RepID=A0AAV4CMZ5_9GAST|nr:hypothetical protein PoB_005973700 [Plakobranchus ocellatus]